MSNAFLKTVQTWDNEKALNELVKLFNAKTMEAVHTNMVVLADILEALDLKSNASFMRHLQSERDYLRNCSSLTAAQLDSHHNP